LHAGELVVDDTVSGEWRRVVGRQPWVAFTAAAESCLGLEMREGIICLRCDLDQTSLDVGNDEIGLELDS
jgi:hypothetical protein